MSELNQVLNHVDTNLDESVERLFEFLRIKSISTDPAFKGECRLGANWLAEQLNKIGFVASVRDTPGHPMVVAHDEEFAQDRDKNTESKNDIPHVLFYGHYDVQPVDPLELWDAPPFEPQIKQVNGRKQIFARGASDDKGNLMTFVEACRAYREVAGAMPLKISFLFEGEEESGSPSLIPFLKANADELTTDLALVCDTGMWDPETPALTTMLRGMVGEEITITGPDRDLHSGGYGGAARNPIHVLTKAIADLRDDTGKITLPGFYEGVIDMPEDVTKEWAKLGATDEAFLGDVGLSVPAGEKGFSALEHIWTRPTCEVNGIWGGYTGDGFKTVLPSIASAKISFRLVGHQDPDKIRASFRAFIRQHVPQDCSVEFAEHGTSPAVFIASDSAHVQKSKSALTDEWGKQAALIGCGGSIPVVGDFKNYLGMESLLIGFALDDDNIHSPNEKYDLTSYHRGIRSWVRILAALAE